MKSLLNLFNYFNNFNQSMVIIPLRSRGWLTEKISIIRMNKKKTVSRKTGKGDEYFL